MFVLIYNISEIAAAATYPGVITLVVIMVFCIIRYYHFSLRRQSLNLQIIQNTDVNEPLTSIYIDWLSTVPVFEIMARYNRLILKGFYFEKQLRCNFFI